MKVYITKYALTQGIERLESNQVKEMYIEEDGYLHIQRTSWHPELYNKKDYALDWKTAFEQAENKRKKKLLSLKKQIKKLEKMKFEEDENEIK